MVGLVGALALALPRLLHLHDSTAVACDALHALSNLCSGHTSNTWRLAETGGWATLQAGAQWSTHWIPSLHVHQSQHLCCQYSLPLTDSSQNAAATSSSSSAAALQPRPGRRATALPAADVRVGLPRNCRAGPGLGGACHGVHPAPTAQAGASPTAPSHARPPCSGDFCLVPRPSGQGGAAGAQAAGV